MTINPKKLRPNRLSLEEMWQLYLLLKDSTANPLLPTLLDNIQYILEHTSIYRINRVLHILYKFDDDDQITDPLDFLILFIKALRANDYYAFVTYMRKY